MHETRDTPPELDRLLAKARTIGLTGREHYRVAEALLKEPGEEGLAAAQVHATLAIASESVNRWDELFPGRCDTLEPLGEAFRAFVARIQRECNAVTGMWERPGESEAEPGAVAQDELETLRRSDAAVRELVADRSGKPIPVGTATVEAVRALLDAQQQPPTPGAPERTPATAVTCQSCGGRKKAGHYLCRVCWYMLPEPTRVQLGRRDPLAYRRLAELQEQLRRDVPLTEITVRKVTS